MYTLLVRATHKIRTHCISVKHGFAGKVRLLTCVGFFSKQGLYFQKCFDVWKGARISKKYFITVQKRIHLPEKV